MNTTKRRPYHSPLREAQARETRERILAGVADWLRRAPDEPFTLDAIAEIAGVERRTVLRHFETKEALLEAFWTWVNARLTPSTLPTTLEELIEAPRTTFARFDDEDGLIRASLHSAPGRAMRLGAVPARRRAFRAALAEVTRQLGAADRRRLEAVAHALYSAAAWETMKDYAGLSGAQAGDAATWALRHLVEAMRPSVARRTRTSTSHGD